MFFSNRKRAVIVISLCAAAFATFIGLRAGSIEKTYISILTKKTAGILANYNNFFSNRVFSKETIPAFLGKATSENNDLAMLAVKDDDFRIMLISPSKEILSNTDLYNALEDEMNLNNTALNEPSSPTIKYFNSKKFYFFYIKGKTGSFAAVYPRSLPKMLIARIVAEGLAVIALTLIVIWIALFYRRPSSTPEPVKKSEAKQKPKRPKNKEEYISEILSSISAEFFAAGVSFFVISGTPRRVKHQYAVKGGKFFSIKSPKPSLIETRKEIIAEIAKGSPVIRDKGRRIIIPIISGKKLAGSLTVSCARKISGTELSQIAQRASSLKEII